MSNFRGGRQKANEIPIVTPPVSITLRSSVSKPHTAREDHRGKSLLSRSSKLMNISESSKSLTGRHFSVSGTATSDQKKHAHERAVSTPPTPASLGASTPISNASRESKSQLLKNSKPTPDSAKSTSSTGRRSGTAASKMEQIIHSSGSATYRAASGSRLTIVQQDSASKSGANQKDRDGNNRSARGRALSTTGIANTQYQASQKIRVSHKDSNRTGPVPNNSIRTLTTDTSKTLNGNWSVSGIRSSQSSTKKCLASGTSDPKNNEIPSSARKTRPPSKIPKIGSLPIGNENKYGGAKIDAENASNTNALLTEEGLDEGQRETIYLDEKLEHDLKHNIKAAMNDFLEPLKATLLEWQTSCGEDKLAFFLKKIQMELQERQSQEVGQFSDSLLKLFQLTFCERKDQWENQRECQEYKRESQRAKRKLDEVMAAHEEELVRLEQNWKSEKEKILAKTGKQKTQLHNASNTITKDELAASNEEITILNETLQITNLRLNALEKEKQDLALELKVANMKLDGLNDESEAKLISLQKDHEEEVRQIRSSLDTLLREKQSLYSELQDTKQEKNDMARKLEETQNKICEFEEMIQTTLQQMHDEVSYLRKTVEERYQEIETLKRQISQDDLKISELTKEAQDARQKLDEQKELIDTLQCSEKKLNAQLDKQNAQITEKTLAVTELRAMLESRNERCKKLSQELTNDREQIIFDENAMRLLEKRHQLSQELREKQDETIAQLQSLNAKLKEALEKECKLRIDPSKEFTEVSTQTIAFVDETVACSQLGQTSNTNAEPMAELRAKNEEIKHLYIELTDLQMALSVRDELILTVQSQKNEIKQKDEELAKLMATLENIEKKKTNTAEGSVQNPIDEVDDCRLINHEFYLEQKRLKRQKEIYGHLKNPEVHRILAKSHKDQ